jgi:hypothetical protein
MNHRYLLPAVCLLAACTAEPMSADPQAKLHMPLTAGVWETHSAKDGKFCTVTSNYRGLSIEKTAAGVRVASNETLNPGEWLTLTVADHRYETTDTYFSDSDAASIVTDFTQGGKAYLRLHRRASLDNADHTLNLDGFSDAYKKCSGNTKKVVKHKKSTSMKNTKTAVGTAKAKDTKKK